MKRVARHIAAFVAIATGLLAGGCSAPQQAIAVDVDPNGWSHQARLILPNTDTTTLRDITFFVRCDQRLSEDTVTLRIAFQTPDTLHYEESFRLFIPRNTTPAALTHEVVVPYRYQVRFPRIGTYLMTLTPTHEVCGIEAIGINIVKSK